MVLPIQSQKSRKYGELSRGFFLNFSRWGAAFYTVIFIPFSTLGRGRGFYTSTTPS